MFKGDDDILLNTFLLKQLLAKYEDHVNEPFMMGSVLRNSPRVTDKSSKENGGLYLIERGLIHAPNHKQPWLSLRSG